MRSSTGKEVFCPNEASCLSLFYSNINGNNNRNFGEEGNNVERNQLVSCVKSFTSYKIRKVTGIFDSVISIPNNR